MGKIPKVVPLTLPYFGHWNCLDWSIINDQPEIDFGRSKSRTTLILCHLNSDEGQLWFINLRVGFKVKTKFWYMGKIPKVDSWTFPSFGHQNWLDWSIINDQPEMDFGRRKSRQSPKIVHYKSPMYQIRDRLFKCRFKTFFQRWSISDVYWQSFTFGRLFDVQAWMYVDRW